MDTLTEKLETLLWDPRTESLRPALNMLVRLLRFIYAVLRDALTSTLTLRAMGLVYVTILSVVPLIAISFSVLKGFGLHESQLRPFLDTFLEPLGPQGIELTDQVMGFVGNIRGGVLAGVGALLLFYTTVSMIKKVEDSFNYIWRVERLSLVFRLLIKVQFSTVVWSVPSSWSRQWHCSRPSAATHTWPR